MAYVGPGIVPELYTLAGPRTGAPDSLASFEDIPGPQPSHNPPASATEGVGSAGTIGPTSEIPRESGSFAVPS